MSRAVLTISILFVLCAFASAQDTKLTYELKSPENWKSEILTLPPAFAKDMQWQGKEDIRFAPGMFDSKSDSFFSYTILFWLPGKQDVTAKKLEKEFLSYYRGLAKAVSGGKLDGRSFRVSFTPEKGKKLQRDGQPLTVFSGQMDWVEPFVTREKQLLHLEVHSWYCEKAEHQVIFVCVSPQKQSATIWQAMRKIRDGFRCVKQGVNGN